jgi:hypothetical protein
MNTDSSKMEQTIHEVIKDLSNALACSYYFCGHTPTGQAPLASDPMIKYYSRNYFPENYCDNMDLITQESHSVKEIRTLFLQLGTADVNTESFRARHNFNPFAI